MNALEAIYYRQSIPRVKPDPVPRDLIEKLLDAAVQAPNHHKVRPWRFVVLTGEARTRLGEVFVQSYKNREPDVMEQALDVERARPLRAPVLIAVGVDRPANEKIIEVENICAAAAAVENLLNAATALGLAAMWRTGRAAYDPDVKQFLGFSPNQNLIGFIYIGYPETEWPPKERLSASDRTIWME